MRIGPSSHGITKSVKKGLQCEWLNVLTAPNLIVALQVADRKFVIPLQANRGRAHRQFQIRDQQCRAVWIIFAYGANQQIKCDCSVMAACF